MRVGTIDRTPVNQAVASRVTTTASQDQAPVAISSSERNSSRQRVESAIQTSSEIALNMAGSFTAKSAVVVVNTKDSLSAIARKINLATSAVDAMVVTLSPPEHKLVIIARDSSNEVALEDKQGRVLKDLGLLTEDNKIAHDSSSERLDTTGSGCAD